MKIIHSGNSSLKAKNKHLLLNNVRHLKISFLSNNFHCVAIDAQKVQVLDNDTNDILLEGATNHDFYWLPMTEGKSLLMCGEAINGSLA